MITVAWPGQSWLDRKIREGDVLLATGPVRFFHGRQLQPREHTLLARTGAEPERTGTIFVTYPASEDVPQWVLRRVFDRNLDVLLSWPIRGGGVAGWPATSSSSSSWSRPRRATAEPRRSRGSSTVARTASSDPSTTRCPFA